jgi:NADH:ubiquinone oxidoreductase subunit K
VLLGVTLLHEHLDAGPLALFVIALSVVAVAVGVAIVARNSPDAKHAPASAEPVAA